MRFRNPNLGEFSQILENLAKDPRGPDSENDTGYPSWVRSSMAAGGTKLRVLRYVLRKARTGISPSLLDVGAQVGAMAAYAAQLGVSVCAVDYDSYAKRFAAILAGYGVDYRACDVAREPLPFAPDTFDFVSYMDVIEHHAFSPLRVLAEIHRVLRPGGRVIITTPNHTSIYNRMSLLVGRSVNDDFQHFFKNCKDWETYPGHHREFTRKEIMRALELSGFRSWECTVFDEDVESQWCSLLQSRRAGSPNGFRSYANFGAAIIGNIFEVTHLPFGRLLWAIGEK